MTATDELRRLLDERGVEWFESVTHKGLTWIYRDGKAIRFHPWQPDTLKVSMFDLTPAQAIEATLGPRITGEATLASRRRKTYTKEYCDCCDGAILPKWDKCPWCGAPLVVDG